MQITKGLPVEKIREIITNENNELLVEIKETIKLKLETSRYLDPRLRKSAYGMLTRASESLPQGYKILVITAYRPYWMQREKWNKRLLSLGLRHPLRMIFDRKKWLRMVRQYTAPPGGSMHQCGSAIDVTLLDSNDLKLDMGTSLEDYGRKVHTFNELISAEQTKNRKILYNAMTQAGFVNYPLEWWHYCYGDKMWAAYTESKNCFYGPLNI